MKKLSKQQLQEIEVLQRDKIIYGIEAIATNTICLLLYIASYDLFFNYEWLRYCLVMIGLSYSLYMGAGNFKRLTRIKQIKNNGE